MKMSTKVAGTLTAAVLLAGAVAAPAGAAVAAGNGGPGNGARAGQSSSAVTQTPATLTPEQQAELTYWVEEEKVARDLYRALAVQYPDLTQFASIANSEQKHMDSVRSLMATYGVTDPTVDQADGVFSDPDLAAMYNELLASATTPEAALAAGATVERKDLEDLNAAKSLFTNADVLRVLNAQIRSSQGHLNAFTR